VGLCRSRGKGFLMGGTAGRTTMLGEGLQHQDGHSHMLSSTVPTCVSYDPAYVYELAVVLAGRHPRMYEEGRERLLLHHHVQRRLRHAGNARGRAEGILRGIYKFKSREEREAVGAALRQRADPERDVLRAQEILAEKYGIAADVWSVTSYTELRRDALAVERWNRLHPAEAEKKPTS
jgi:pyruvate dehydrogenase E1 component